MADWEALHNYLQPVAPQFCPEEPSVTQKVFLMSQHKEALFGGAAGGGKSSALLMAALQYVDVPNYTAILFRKTFADLALPGALMDRFLQWVKGVDEIHWNANTNTATFPSGARITFGYLNNVNDRLRYKSAEFQFIGMDEVTEIREGDYRYLFSRLRRPKSGPLSKVPLRMRAASNPAPNWVRQRFIVEGKDHGRIFVQSFLEDNPGVDHASYRGMLEELTPVERAQLADGEWFVQESGDLFKREDFEIIEPEDIPPLLSPKTVRWWDLAGTKPSSAYPDPDYTVGMLLAFDRGVTYVLDMKRIRDESPVVEALIAQTAAEDGVGVPIRMEREPGSSGKSLANMYSRNIIPGYDFAAIPSTGDKVTRARPFASAVANNNVRIVRGPWLTDFLDEMTAFHSEKGSATAHDDIVDSTSSAFSFVTGISGMQRKKISIVV